MYVFAICPSTRNRDSGDAPGGGASGSYASAATGAGSGSGVCSRSWGVNVISNDGAGGGPAGAACDSNPSPSAMGERREQRLAHRVLHAGERIAFVGQPYFALVRVHVHVHLAGRHVQEHDCYREAPLHQQAPVRLFHRDADRAVLDPAAVHEQADPRAVRTALLRRPHEAPYGIRARPRANLDHRLRQLRAVHARDRVPQAAVAGRGELQSAVGLERELHVRMRHRQVVHRLPHARRLRRGRADELQPRRNRREECLDLNRRPRSRARRRLPYDFAAFQFDRHR